jgi:hypothetical protein
MEIDAYGGGTPVSAERQEGIFIKDGTHCPSYITECKFPHMTGFNLQRRGDCQVVNYYQNSLSFSRNEPVSGDGKTVAEALMHGLRHQQTQNEAPTESKQQ